ncbi:L-threonylcarbamoyladenylate synthase [Rhodopirellula bahusiensis]|uniref:Threonylcarbamoyl-AMP synthase n=1 Tax=Rhodopirellula bahusiensis TaxID=2014065 RepID=A0A2G1W3U3_9BACT|nr:L-threonylcarbamoyladenylate synthase [Rhodopirellula bahusiensis]PHQ33665.1 threonylcarbamoyl-AMP synthase [Rhodopirellula bahusiensis]
MNLDPSHLKILPATPESIRLASDALRDGKLIGLPTETVYGLAARGDRPDSVAKIFAAKQRPATNPLILHVGDPDAVHPLVSMDSDITRRRFAAASSLWPGPLTLVLPRSESVLDCVTAGGNTVAVRVPAHPVALQLLREVSLPIAAPSANVSNYISPTRPEHVIDGLVDSVEWVLDGGNCDVGLESTVLSIADPKSPPTILREGVLSAAKLEAVFGEPVLSSATTNMELLKSQSNAPAASPGLHRKHYSPRTPLRLVAATENVAPSNDGGNNKSRILRIRLRGPAVSLPGYADVWSLSPAGDPFEIANRLYDALRRADSGEFESIEIDQINVQEWSEAGNPNLLAAISDRLRRASNQDDSAT